MIPCAVLLRAHLSSARIISPLGRVMGRVDGLGDAI